MTQKELIEKLKKLASGYKAEAEWGSMFASGPYSVVADDLETLIKEAEDESYIS